MDYDEVQKSINQLIEISKGEYELNPDALNMVTSSPQKCPSCKHDKDRPFFHPGENINPDGEWLFHFKDSHGYDPEFAARWLVALVYSHKETGEPLIKELPEYALTQE